MTGQESEATPRTESPPTDPAAVSPAEDTNDATVEESDETTAETVSLAFAKVDVEYRPQKSDGSLEAGLHFKYDIKSNKPG